MTEIRPQSETHNPAGVVRPDLLFELDLRVEVLNIGLRLTTAQARGWAAVARTPGEVARAIQQAITEAQVSAYARARGESYDLDVITEPSELHPLTASAIPRVRGDIYDPQDWTPLPDGRWRSPSGRVYRADAQVVQRVQAKRHPGVVAPQSMG